MSASTERSNATSRSLIARVRARDAEAWERLVALYAPYVLDECRRARLGPADLADVFQEVFQAAFTRIATFEQRESGGKTVHGASHLGGAGQASTAFYRGAAARMTNHGIPTGTVR